MILNIALTEPQSEANLVQPEQKSVLKGQKQE